jgi:hypothetical protein
MNDMNARTLESIDLDALETVVGGGRLWRKIKRGVKNWANQLAEVLLDDAKKKTIDGGNAGEGDTVETSDD